MFKKDSLIQFEEWFEWREKVLKIFFWEKDSWINLHPEDVEFYTENWCVFMKELPTKTWGELELVLFKEILSMIEERSDWWILDFIQSKDINKNELKDLYYLLNWFENYNTLMFKIRDKIDTSYLKNM